VEVRHDVDSRTFTLTFGLDDVTDTARTTTTTKVSSAQLIWQPPSSSQHAPAGVDVTDDVTQREAAGTAASRPPPLSRILTESTEEPPDTPTSPDSRKSQFFNIVIVSSLSSSWSLQLSLFYLRNEWKQFKKISLQFVPVTKWVQSNAPISSPPRQLELGNVHTNNQKPDHRRRFSSLKCTKMRLRLGFLPRIQPQWAGEGIQRFSKQPSWISGKRLVESNEAHFENVCLWVCCSCMWHLQQPRRTRLHSEQVARTRTIRPK